MYMYVLCDSTVLDYNSFSCTYVWGQSNSSTKNNFNQNLTYHSPLILTYCHGCILNNDYLNLPEVKGYNRTFLKDFFQRSKVTMELSDFSERSKVTMKGFLQVYTCISKDVSVSSQRSYIILRSRWVATVHCANTFAMYVALRWCTACAHRL